MRYMVKTQPGVGIDGLLGSLRPRSWSSVWPNAKYPFRRVTKFPRLGMFAFEYDENVDLFDLADVREESSVKYLCKDMPITLGDVDDTEVALQSDATFGSTTKLHPTGDTTAAEFSGFVEYFSQLELLNSMDPDSSSEIHDYTTTKTGSGVDIYMVDTGANFSHPGLVGKVSRCPTFGLNLSGAEDQDDETNNGHGTYGSLCAAGLDGQGVAPDAQIFALKVFDSDGSGSIYNIVDAVHAVMNHHYSKNTEGPYTGRPSILNASLGLPMTGSQPFYYHDETGPDHIYYDVFKSAARDGIHVVVAAGNSFMEGGEEFAKYGPSMSMFGNGRLNLPFGEQSGNYDDGQGIPIVVGATRIRNNHTTLLNNPTLFTQPYPGHMASFSKYGRGNTLNAPGQWIPTPQWDWGLPETQANSWQWINGTSFAAPIVSGLLALHLEANPTHSTTQAKQALTSFATRNMTPNLMRPLELQPENYNILYHDNDQTLTVSFTPPLTSDQLEVFQKITSKTPNQRNVTFGPVGQNDLIQLSFPFDPNHVNANWHHLWGVDENELKLGFTGTPDANPAGPVGPVRISVVTGTHEETDGMKIWQKKTDPDFDWDELGDYNRIINYPEVGDEFEIRDVEYTDDLVAFNPYQPYDITWLSADTIELDYNAPHASRVEASIKTLLRNEQPADASFELLSGTLPPGWQLGPTGQFHITEYDASIPYTNVITIRATNGFQSFEKEFSVEVSSLPPVSWDDELRAIHNIAWYGSCESSQSSGDYDLSQHVDDIEAVYQVSESGLGVVSWTPATNSYWGADLPDYISQAFSSLIPGFPYYIKTKGNLPIEIPGIRANYDSVLGPVGIGNGCIGDTFVPSEILSARYNMIWYGMCETNSIQSFQLEPGLGIEEVYRATTDTSENILEKWIASDYINADFTSLEAGYGYFIKLEDSEQIVTIPGAVVRKFPDGPDNMKAKYCLTEFPTSTPSPSSASYSNVYSFGNSYTDSGNYPETEWPLAENTWVEYLAQKFNLTLLPSTDGGTNYAWGGARLVEDIVQQGTEINIPSIKSQINSVSSFDSNDLVTFFGGGNDYFSGMDATYISNGISENLNLLVSKGAKTIVLLNMVNLNLLPGVQAGAGLGDTPATSELVSSVNSTLVQTINQLKINNSDVNVYLYDFYTLSTEIISNPSAFGITEVFYDTIHMTEEVHSILAENCYNLITNTASTPTPPDPTPTPVQPDPVVCPEDALECPDGTILSRDPALNCEFPPCPPSGGELIWNLTYHDDTAPFTTFQKEQIQLALDKWSSVITNDWVIDLDVAYVDPADSAPSGVLAYAGPDWTSGTDTHSIPWMTISGIVRVDPLDINGNGAKLDSTIVEGDKTEFYYMMLHELGHVLGIGTLWNYPESFSSRELVYNGNTGELITGWVEDYSVLNPVYKGVYALAAYNEVLGLSGDDKLDALPIEDGGGPGTGGGHPEEGDNTRFIGNVALPGLDNELMTGFINAGVPNPLSIISIGMLQDLGWDVNYSAADEYTLNM